jgi:hypothetical protein
MGIYVAGQMKILILTGYFLENLDILRIESITIC